MLPLFASTKLAVTSIFCENIKDVKIKIKSIIRIKSTINEFHYYITSIF
ncbi:hypothetical protein BN3087_400018 [Sulfurovum sp. enrichment culture clone C5]|uniref:Uncharacterized protein n=1 Tax=Sulfurovum sp. enrichment culture clone C5 TaxID=497650 RepID=A0A0S4XMV7_9BACT|nr:hypothetical protein BN3087_400018 [Sulfurovum sp. enrichment culture clone C5]